MPPRGGARAGRRVAGPLPKIVVSAVLSGRERREPLCGEPRAGPNTAYPVLAVTGARNMRLVAQTGREVQVRHRCLLLREFRPRMVCTRCGIVGADARPNWREMKASGDWRGATT